MRILWITNIVFPEAQSFLHRDNSIKGSGGWLVGASEMLIHQADIQLFVCSVTKEVKELTKIEGENITYFLLPFGRGNMKVNHDYEPLWRQIRDEVHPDIIHIHGTEYSQGLAWIDACGVDHLCVSIQGLRHAIYDNYICGLTKKEIILASTPVSIVFGGLFKESRNYKRCGEYGKRIIQSANHIIGRTSWDCSHVWALNPNAKYHHGGETLRPDFYGGDVWEYSKCQPHTIFLSQARTPIKGLHMVLRAMPLVLRYYPDAVIRVAGPDITRSGSWKELLRISDYGNIIRKIIKKYNLKKHIVFTGLLDGQGMRSEYLRCNVFACPSSIENSPNSLGEAQLLGVPVVASYVGGTPDMMKGDEGHLYRFEEVEMLAKLICDIFGAGANQPQLAPMRQAALERHNPENNVQELMEIYKEVAK